LKSTSSDTGADMHQWATDLFPICRSLTGDGVRSTLRYLQQLLPTLKTFEIPSGTRAFDWEVPREWAIRDAYIADAEGNRLVDFNTNNLHVVGYSMPIDAVLSKAELDKHLYSLPELPHAIPYVTSYYSETWGFCLSHDLRANLGEGPFRVLIDSELKVGSLSYGELIIPGDTSDEILLSTYVCHPSMANNELSGPVVTTALARWILGLEDRHYTYRIVMVPETIGSVVYLSLHLRHLQEHLKAGWVLTCIGDDRAYSYLPSPSGGTFADRVSKKVMSKSNYRFDEYSFLDRGSDERQYCSPGVDLPVVSLMRSKYGTYPEYHTSLDDLSLVTPSGLQGGLDMMKAVVGELESSPRWRSTVLGEPQMGKRGLYPTTSTSTSAHEVYDMMNVLAFCDGTHDTEELASICNITVSKVEEIVNRLFAAGVLSR
jgi:aminopeptidase-like protein